MSSLRREPTQDRSKQRVERLLRAATSVVAEDGDGAATTEAIALRADVPIGSLYQFFPNKKALFEAVGARYLEEGRQLFDAFLTPELLERPWYEITDDAIDAFWVYQRQSLGFEAIRKSVLSPEFLAAGNLVNREIAKRIETVLARFSSLQPKRRELVATVVVESISAMLVVAAHMKEPRASNLIAETKVLLRRYLEPYADRVK